MSVDEFGPLPSVDLVSRIESAADQFAANVTFVTSVGSETRSWRAVYDEARSLASALQVKGVSPGDVVALMALTSREVVAAVQAVWLCGAAVVMLPIPMRMSPGEPLGPRAMRQAERARARLVLADELFGPELIGASGTIEVIELAQLIREGARLGSGRLVPSARNAGSLAVLQLTSGSTDEPKLVCITDGRIAANHGGIIEAAGLTFGAERVVSWLPLYHDMGLIGFCILPMAGGAELTLVSPDVFISTPARWIAFLAEAKATVSGGPSFAFGLASRTMHRHSGLELGSVRVVFNGGEPVNVAATEAFLNAGAPAGLRRSAMRCVYGMAEATLMITCPGEDRGFEVDRVDSRELGDGYARPSRATDATQLVKVGRVISGLELRVVAPGADRPIDQDRVVGELLVRGTSVADRYFDSSPDVPGAADGWMRTGDLGYRLGDEYVVCGRTKDIIILAGRKLFPEDIEAVAAEVNGVRQGNVIAFGVVEARRERLVVVAECRVLAETSRREVATAVRAVAGSTPKVVFVEPGSLPKTPSGKLRRAACRSRFLAGELATL